MHELDRRAEHLGWVENHLRTANPEFPVLRISAQAHYGPPDHIAFIDIYGVDEQQAQRRNFRSEACALLRRLGYTVQLEPERDVYIIMPLRPTSAHERLQMLRQLHQNTDGRG